MIAEATIETILNRLEQGEADYETQIAGFATQQPELADYLTNEDVEAFTETERGLLLFAAIVVQLSAEEELGSRPPVDGEAISSAEERNYELIQNSGGKSFRERLTPLFEESPEEELLAFVEDLILEEEGENEISREAREPFFVTLKTVVDTLT